MIPLSILDLAQIPEGKDASHAFTQSVRIAQFAETAGFTRMWFAEHHNTAAVAASATSVLIALAAERTSRIRVGSGGVMLPNHAPLMVAEQFGTLAQVHPGRIDLGLGRAPGTDPMTAQALARSSSAPEAFMSNVADLVDWFGARGAANGITVGVARGTEVPLWVLGSSTFGAAMAAHLGLPFSFASHFAPNQMSEALSVYRDNFDADAPTAQIPEPKVSIGVNVMACPDPAEAEHQFTVVRNMFVALHRTGGRLPVQPPGPPADDVDELELIMADRLLSVRAVGSPQQVRDQLQQLADRTGADELITVTYAFDPEVRRRSLELVAAAWNE